MTLESFLTTLSLSFPICVHVNQDGIYLLGLVQGLRERISTKGTAAGRAEATSHKSWLLLFKFQYTFFCHPQPCPNAVAQRHDPWDQANCNPGFTDAASGHVVLFKLVRISLYLLPHTQSAKEQGPVAVYALGSGYSPFPKQLRH